MNESLCPPVGSEQIADIPAIHLATEDISLSVLFPLFQRGFWVRCRVGCTLQELLCDQLEVSSRYVVDNITTLFVDGQPVDDLAAFIDRPGMVIALSSAMPGLLGAVMRRGGPCAALRDTITYREHGRQGEGGCGPGFVRVKLFNKVMTDLGTHFLARGIFVDSASICDLLMKRLQEPGGPRVRIVRGAAELDWRDFCERGEDPWVLLRSK